jgi:hypothetical protein
MLGIFPWDRREDVAAAVQNRTQVINSRESRNDRSDQGITALRIQLNASIEDDVHVSLLEEMLAQGRGREWNGRAIEVYMGGVEESGLQSL